MQIPGHIDPVVTPRAVTPRSDGRIDLMGLSHLQIRQLFEESQLDEKAAKLRSCLLYTSPSPRDRQKSRMPSSA